MLDKKFNYKITNQTICIFLAIMVLITYFRAFNFDFISLDDSAAVVENPYIKNGLNLKSLLWAFSTTYYDYWHPLTWITHIIDWQIYGSNAGGHHFTNIIIHLINTMLLYSLILSIFNSKLKGFFIASIFAIHPMHIESVVWIVERKDVLSMLFALLAMLFYSKYTTYRNLKYYFISIIMLTLGLMAKPMLMTLPFILILIDYLKNEKDIINNLFSIKKHFFIILNKVPFFILSFTSAIVTYQIVKSIDSITSSKYLSITTKLSNVIYSYYKHFINFFIPFKISIFHPYNDSIPISNIIIATLVLLTLTLLSILLFKRYPSILVGWLWFIGSLVPVIGFIQSGSQARADRYVYFPYIGIYIIAASLLLKGEKISKYTKVFILPVFLLYLFFIHSYQISFWKDSKTLYSRAIHLNDEAFLIHNNLGQLYASQNQLDSAEYHFDKILSCKKINFKLATYNKGIINLQRKKYAEAKSLFIKILKNDSLYHDAYSGIGYCYKETNNDSLAKLYFNKCINIDTNNYMSNFNLGLIYNEEEKYDSAIIFFKNAINKNIPKWELYSELGLSYYHKKDYISALKMYQKALEIDAMHFEPYNNIALIHIDNGNFKDALSIIDYAIKKFPKTSSLHINKAKAHYSLNEFNIAKTHFIIAEDLDSTLNIPYKALFGIEK